MSYSFSTKKGTTTSVRIPVYTDVAGLTLRAEFSRDTDWSETVYQKAIEGSGEAVVLQLTSFETDDLATVRYRIVGTGGGSTRVLQSGIIRHILPPKTAGLSIDSPELIATFVPRAEYVAGEGADPAAIEGLIDTKVDAHVFDTTPHPSYDDLPSLRLLFENGLI